MSWTLSSFFHYAKFQRYLLHLSTDYLTFQPKDWHVKLLCMYRKGLKKSHLNLIIKITWITPKHEKIIILSLKGWDVNYRNLQLLLTTFIIACHESMICKNSYSYSSIRVMLTCKSSDADMQGLSKWLFL